jgi:hypothetical protein
VSLFRSEIVHDLEAQGHVREWTAALRGGGYAQTREGFLRTPRGFCCLGVACDRYDPRGWSRAEEGWSYLGAIGHLPPGLAEVYLLCTTDGRFGPHLESDSLASANDQGASFPELADLMERELEAALARRGRREAPR